MKQQTDMKSPGALILIVAALAAASQAKVFTRCELANELLKHGFNQTLLPDWVCLVEYASGRSTSEKLGLANAYQYGLFQIKENIFCQTGKKGKFCRANCEDLITEDITEASKCAQKMFKQLHFKPWTAWEKYCKKEKPDLSFCFDK